MLFNYHILVNIFFRQSRHVEMSFTRSYSLSPDFIKSFNTVLLFVIPLFFINAIIGRYCRYASLINLIFMLNVISDCKTQSRKKLFVLTLIYAAFFGWLHIYGRMEVVDQVLNHNRVLDLFIR